ncbi:TolA protein [Pseudomonas chlororaphis]|uniref:hypothetical protein n=1 Tax=Pseudomonas chlororaphis TaxID=587753 RepID=UPI000F562086|nr:hypothetical protein [Pseudomonas chlororaphis]AZD07522.1 TolA protein [Pseudomonas chlororaphis]
MSAQTELAVVPPQETALAVYSKPNGLEPWLQQIRSKIDGFTPDISTRKGREAIASMAYAVARSKTALDDVGKKLVADLKEVPKKIDAERKRVRDTLEAWQEEVRRPLNEWEEAEAAKKREIEAWVGELRLDPQIISAADSEYLRISIGAFENIVIDGEWLGDHEAEALRLKADTLAALRSALEKREQYEAEQAELARLRAEAEAREQKDREERIAREAAERARIEAEQKAQAEREATLLREQEAKAAAERRELELKLQAEQAERAAAQAKADQAAAEQRAEQERQAATQRAEQAAEQARIEERRRADAAAAEIVRQQEARERDEAHRRTINRSALEAFVAGGMTEECAKQAITLIALRKIPAISIQY